MAATTRITAPSSSLASQQQDESLICCLWSWPTRKVILLVIHFLATLFTILALTKCSFMIENNPHDDDDNSSSTSNTSHPVEVGLFSRSVYDNAMGTKLGCVAYTNPDAFDSMLQAGRTFGTMTALFATTSLFCACLVLCCGMPRRRRYRHIVWKLGHYLLMSSTVAQMFTFFALGSDYLCQVSDCKLTGVGILSAFNVIFLSIASVMYFLEAVPEAGWFVWWEEPLYEFERKYTSRTTAEASRQGSSTRTKARTVNACPAAAIKEIDPYNLPPSFSIASVDSRMSSSSAMRFKSQRSFRIILLGLFIVSWILSIVGVQNCTFLLVGPSNGTQDNFSGMGLFSRAVYYRGKVIGCIDYPEMTKIDFDSPFQAGRVFGAVTAFLMTFICMLKVAQVFVDKTRNEIWLVIRLLLPCATLSQLLTFFVYKTETCSMSELIDCVPGKLGVWVILNVLIMISLCVIVNFVPPPLGPLLSLNLPNSPPLPTPGGMSTASEHPLPKVFRSKLPILEPKEMYMVQPRGVVPDRRRDEGDYTTAGDSYIGGGNGDVSSTVPERIVRIQPLHEQAELITVSVEYSGNEKKTIKTLTHPDGSQTITTTIEEMDDDATTDYYDGDGSIDGSYLSTALEDANLDDIALDEEVMRLTGLYSRRGNDGDEAPRPIPAISGDIPQQGVRQPIDSRYHPSSFAPPRTQTAINTGGIAERAIVQVNNSDDLD